MELSSAAAVDVPGPVFAAPPVVAGLWRVLASAMPGAAGACCRGCVEAMLCVDRVTSRCSPGKPTGVCPVITGMCSNKMVRNALHVRLQLHSDRLFSSRMCCAGAEPRGSHLLRVRCD